MTLYVAIQSSINKISSTFKFNFVLNNYIFLYLPTNYYYYYSLCVYYNKTLKLHLYYIIAQ